jgi:uncharacterized protein (TIGR00369 family)
MSEAAAAAAFNTRQIGYLPGVLGFDWVELRNGYAFGRFEIAQQHLAPNGYLHAGSVVALADTACGYGCIAHLPDGAENFTTVELKSNFLGTARDGVIACIAKPGHLGRTTQVWDATVSRQHDGKPIALFRCTQMILWPNGFCAAGAFFLGFGIMHSMIFNNVSALFALGNGLLPLRKVAQLQAEREVDPDQQPRVQ